MVEVYRTNIVEPEKAEMLEDRIRRIYPHLKVSFDLEDCDNILRIEYQANLNRSEIEAISKNLGLEIKILDY